MSKRLSIFSVIFGLLIFFSSCQRKNALVSIIQSDPSVAAVAEKKEYEVQILYTSVKLKDSSFVSYAYNISNKEYFYPASMVKLPVAILAVERLNELKKEYPRLHLETDMINAAAREVQTEGYMDFTTKTGIPNPKRYIERILLVSENDPYNRLYEFLGPDYINQKLREKGVFSNGSVINHRLSVMGYDIEENRHTNPISFVSNDSLIYRKHAQYDSLYVHNMKGAKKGKAYINDSGTMVFQPFDFTEKNYFHIRDMESTMTRLFYPEKYPKNQRFILSDSEYSFFKKTLSSYPGDYTFYQNMPKYTDNYAKYFMIGDTEEKLPEYISIHNKVGQAYGYLIDCAYIEDKKNGIAFFLTAVVHVNQNGIFNDNNYEYDHTGIPFLARLGRAVYEYELKKK
jgi:hypothetical protein